MTADNVERVWSIFEPWSRGDFSSSDWADPEIEFAIDDGPSPGSWTGIREMAAAWAEAMRPWERFSATAEECRALDEERVLVLTRHTGRGKGSGVEAGAIAARGANLFWLKAGKVTRLVIYFDRQRALAELDAA